MSNPVLYRDLINPVFLRWGVQLLNGVHTITLTLEASGCQPFTTDIQLTACSCTGKYDLDLRCENGSPKLGIDIGFYKAIYRDNTNAIIHSGYLTVRKN